MASGGGSKQGSSSRGSPPAAWTQRQNKQFECALAVHDKDTPDRWHNVARYMGGTKSADEVHRHFEQLVDDVAEIEAGHVPFPCYSSISSFPPARGLGDATGRCRMRHGGRRHAVKVKRKIR